MPEPENNAFMHIDAHAHAGFDPLYYLQGWSPYALDLPRLLNEAAGTGIERFVVFPFVAYMALDQGALREGRVMLPEDGDAVPYEFENRRLCGDIRRGPPDYQRRFWPFLIADPARRPAAQVQAWRRLPGDYQVYGLKFQTHTIQSPILTLLEEGSCLLDYAEEHDLTLVIHTSIHPDDVWSRCADVLRVVEARPALRFMLAHSCRFHLPTLRRVAELPNAWFDCAAFTVHCECARRNLPAVAAPGDRFPSNHADPAQVLADLAEAFPDKLIWGSDAPYYTIEYDRLQIRGTYAADAAALNTLTPETRDRIAHRNTVAWLGRDPDVDRVEPRVETDLHFEMKPEQENPGQTHTMRRP